MRRSRDCSKFFIVLFIYQGEPEEANDEGGNIAV